VDIEKYVLWRGSEFVIEWYYKENGKSPGLEYFLSMPLDRRKKLVRLASTMAEVGSIMNNELFRHEGDQIYAFKPQPYRFLCFFFLGGKVIITNGFEKKSQKLPSEEKDRALRHKSDYIARVNKGTYYE
jgi:phage-related protein